MSHHVHILLLTALSLPAFAITQPPRLPQGRSEKTTDYRLQTTANSPLPTANRPLPTDSPSQITNNELPMTYDRYAVIETRMPFGDESAAAALAAAAAVASQPVVESFTKVLKMCAITRNRFNGKVQVGIVNTLTKKNYFLYEGDTEDGMELVKADYESEKALLRKGDEEVWMDMAAIVSASVPSGPAAGRIPGMRIPSASMAVPDAAAASVNGTPAPVEGGPQSLLDSQGRSSSRQFGRGRSFDGGGSAPPAGVGVEGTGGVGLPRPASVGSQGAVVQSRQVGTVTVGVPGVNSLMSTEPVPAQPAPTPAQPARPRLTGEALKEHLKSYQMELIRAGGRKGPPLPMQLTPEMDAQLVNEGVLPSAE